MPTAVAVESHTDQQSAEQFFEHSGAGPVMDDEPASTETGVAQPSAEEFFQHSGTGPVMDDEPAMTPRQ
ncbi:hypothetical protein ACFWPK_16895 [Nocardia sp. NPDC058519]|uniref:hypothetical protein n=1 Tax=Nocardia sp. NPDC058519 TaxID=3346535 RepID=UPI003655BE07